MALCCTMALVVMTLRSPSLPGETVAIFFPPRTDLVEAIAAVGQAGGVVERTGRWDNIVVASFPGREPPVDALRSAGAWLVFNAIVAGGCDAVGLLKGRQSALDNADFRPGGHES